MQASQQAIEKVAAAIGTNELPVMFLIGDKYVDAMRQLSDSENAKLVMLPADIPAAISSLVKGAKPGNL